MATLGRKDLFCYSSSAQAIVLRIQGCRGLKRLLTLGSHSVHIMNVHCRSLLISWVFSPWVQHNRQAFSPGSPQSRQTLTSMWAHLPSDARSVPFSRWGAPLTLFHLRVPSNPQETPAYLSMSTTRKRLQGAGMSTRSLQGLPKVSLLWQT